MKILVAGDFCPQGRVEKCLESDRYDYIFSDVQSLAKEADFSIVNFECPVLMGEAKAITKVGPNLHCTEKGVQAIKYAGFNIVTLANNHFYDYGEKGVQDTIQILKQNGLDYVGGGMKLSEASQVLYKDLSGETLAIINCCEHEFSIATENSAGSNPLNPVQQFYTIQEAKQHANRVIVIVHGGHEHFQLPSPRMVETYRFFIDSGADAIINHHQHCYSGYEVYKGKPIFYGIGNFCFDNPQKRNGIWTEGYMIMIDFLDKITSFKIIPFTQCAEEPIVRILPRNSFDERLRELNSIIADPIALMKYINIYYEQCADTYSNVFEPIQNRYYLGAKRRGWVPSLIRNKQKLSAFNYINCEAHRDKMLFWLKQ